MIHGDVQHANVLQDTKHHLGCYLDAKLAVGVCKGMRTT